MRTYTLASSLPRSLTGVPDLGDMRWDADSSSWPRILPGHQDPFLRRTQTMVPTLQSTPVPPPAPSNVPILAGPDAETLETRGIVTKQRGGVPQNRRTAHGRPDQSAIQPPASKSSDPQRHRTTGGPPHPRPPPPIFADPLSHSSGCPLAASIQAVGDLIPFHHLLAPQSSSLSLLHSSSSLRSHFFFLLPKKPPPYQVPRSKNLQPPANLWEGDHRSRRPTASVFGVRSDRRLSAPPPPGAS